MKQKILCIYYILIKQKKHLDNLILLFIINRMKIIQYYEIITFKE